MTGSLSSQAPGVRSLSDRNVWPHTLATTKTDRQSNLASLPRDFGLLLFKANRIVISAMVLTAMVELIIGILYKFGCLNLGTYRRVDRLNNSEAITEAQEREISVLVGWQHDFDLLLGRIHLAMDKNREKERKTVNWYERLPTERTQNHEMDLKWLLKRHAYPFFPVPRLMRSLPC